MLNLVTRLLLIIFGISMANASTQELDQTAIKDLEDSSIWLITEATGKLYADPSYSSRLQQELFHKYQLNTHNSPKLNAGSEILRYIPKARGIYYDIELLKNAEFWNDLYEYWIIYITSLEWATAQLKECRFIVTKTPNKIQNRVILKMEKQFFHSFNVNNTVVFNLDYKHDLQLRYKLRPWYFEKYFINYPEITKEEIVILNDGSYKATR